MKFDRHIGSTAAEVPVKFQSDRIILNKNLAASRLYEILRKDVFSDIETGPCWQKRPWWCFVTRCKKSHIALIGPASKNVPFCNRNVHISVSRWCIVRYLSGALWDFKRLVLETDWFVSSRRNSFQIWVPVNFIYWPPIFNIAAIAGNIQLAARCHDRLFGKMYMCLHISNDNGAWICLCENEIKANEAFMHV